MQTLQEEEENDNNGQKKKQDKTKQKNPKTNLLPAQQCQVSCSDWFPLCSLACMISSECARGWRGGGDVFHCDIISLHPSISATWTHSATWDERSSSADGSPRIYSLWEKSVTSYNLCNITVNLRPEVCDSSTAGVKVPSPLWHLQHWVFF